MQRAVSDFFQKVSLVYRGISEIFKNLAGTKSHLDQELAKEIKAAGLWDLVMTVSKVFLRIKNLLGGFVDGLKSIGTSVVNVFEWVATKLTFVFSPLAGVVTWVSSLFWDLAASTGAGKWQTFGKILGWVVGGLVAFWGVGKVLLVVVKGLTVVFGALSAVFTFLAANPIVLIMLGIAAAVALVSYGVYKLVQNWDFLVNAFLNFAPIVWIKEAFKSVYDFLSGINLYEAGAKILGTLANGIKSAVSGIVDAVTGVFGKIRKLLPFSDAAEGPLSELTMSGTRIMETLAAGVKAGSPALKTALSGTLAGLALTASVKMPPSLGTRTLQATPKAVRIRPFSSGKEEKIVNIRIGSIKLPNVKNAQDFAEELKRLVDHYDV